MQVKQKKTSNKYVDWRLLVWYTVHTSHSKNIKQCTVMKNDSPITSPHLTVCRLACRLLGQMTIKLYLSGMWSRSRRLGLEMY